MGEVLLMIYIYLVIKFYIIYYLIKKKKVNYDLQKYMNNI